MINGYKDGEEKHQLPTPHIANVGQSELLITACQGQLSVPGQVAAPKSATAHMRKRYVG